MLVNKLICDVFISRFSCDVSVTVTNCENHCHCHRLYLLVDDFKVLDSLHLTCYHNVHTLIVNCDAVIYLIKKDKHLQTKRHYISILISLRFICSHTRLSVCAIFSYLSHTLPSSRTTITKPSPHQNSNTRTPH